MSTDTDLYITFDHSISYVTGDSLVIAPAFSSLIWGTGILFTTNFKIYSSDYSMTKQNLLSFTGFFTITVDCSKMDCVG